MHNSVETTNGTIKEPILPAEGLYLYSIELFPPLLAEDKKKSGQQPKE